MNSYHVGLDGHQETITRAMAEWFRHYMPDHAPVWTILGVPAPRRSEDAGRDPV
ncbi:MAG: hypothetical protein NW701_17290 [Nitrospira sp.]